MLKSCGNSNTFSDHRKPAPVLAVRAHTQDDDAKDGMVAGDDGHKNRIDLSGK
jgi:hypothetical protein